MGSFADRPLLVFALIPADGWNGVGSRRKDHSEIKSFTCIFANIAEYIDDKSDYLKQRQGAPDQQGTF